MLHRVAVSYLWLASSLFSVFTAHAANPNVRALTAFVDLDSAHYEQQFANATAKLRQAQALFVKAGYPVQTVRITTQPYMNYVEKLGTDQALALLLRLEQLGRQNNVGVDIGPAAVDDQPDARALALLEALHGRGASLNASMIVASDTGVHWNTVRAAAHHIKQVAESSPLSQGTFSFAATAMIEPGSPFFPGSYHVHEGGRFSVGLESANVVAEVLATAKGNSSAATSALTAALSKHALQVHRIAEQIEQQTGLKYWGLDPTPAPLKDVSIGAAMESFNSTAFGSAGTMTAAYTITQAVRNVPGPRVGYSGLMLPVMEDARIAQRWNEGLIDISALLAYSAVCGTGLDAVALPGDVTEDELSRIIGDVAVLAFKWKKPLTARLQPVHGKKAGEMSDFNSPYLINVKLQPVR